MGGAVLKRTRSVTVRSPVSLPVPIGTVRRWYGRLQFSRSSVLSNEKKPEPLEKDLVKMTLKKHKSAQELRS